MTDLLLTIDGGRFDDIPGFYAEINRVFMAGEDWQLGESLDALDDLFHGGYGSMLGAASVRLRWRQIDKSRRDLGQAATRDWLLAKQAQPGRFNAQTIGRQLDALDRGTGQTYFQIVAEIIASHPRITLIEA